MVCEERTGLAGVVGSVSISTQAVLVITIIAQWPTYLCTAIIRCVSLHATLMLAYCRGLGRFSVGTLQKPRRHILFSYVVQIH